MNTSIHDVTKENIAEIKNLSVSSSQEDYVDSTKDCLIEALENDNYKPVGLYMDEKIVGFAMYGNITNKKKQSRVYLDHFLIDAKYQGLGLGKTMLNKLIHKLTKEFSCEKIYLSVVNGNTAACRLYEKLGFQFNGESEVKNEKIMVKTV